jgi:hypothetical protein
MNRAVLQRRLAEAEEQIANGLRHIARQRELIAELESNGHPTGHAKYLLAGLELLQAARLDSRDWLLEQLSKKAGCSGELAAMNLSRLISGKCLLRRRLARRPTCATEKSLLNFCRDLMQPPLSLICPVLMVPDLRLKLSYLVFSGSKFRR